MDLSGTWRACGADEDLRRTFPSPDFDDGAWAELDVPGHWRSTPAFADTDGPLLYRTPLRGAAPPADGRRSWLVLDGLFYQGDVWLDGAYVGDTEGYFFPHTFEVTEPLRDRDRARARRRGRRARRQRDRTAKRNITGVFQHWDCLDPDWNPGGIWRPVRLEETGPVRIRRLRVLCREATAEQAVLAVTRRRSTPPRPRTVRAAHDGRRRHRARPRAAAGRRREPGRVAGHRRATRRCGGPTPSATSRCTTSPSTVTSPTTSEPSDTPHASAPACARCA